MMNFHKGEGPVSLSDNLRAKDWTFSSTSRVAQRRRSIALYVLLGSLAMFFGAALLGYLMIRLRAGAAMPRMEMPPILWLSTVFALVGGTFLGASVRSIRRERQQQFRQRLLIAFLFGVGFSLSQTVGLAMLLKTHQQTMREIAALRQDESESMNTPRVVVPGQSLREEAARKAQGDTQAIPTPPAHALPNVHVMERRLEGLVFVLILAHCLHFVGGMVALSIVTWRGLKGRYDHEYHGGLRLCAVYWRFLDVVWLVLFASFLFTE